MVFKTTGRWLIFNNEAGLTIRLPLVGEFDRSEFGDTMWTSWSDLKAGLEEAERRLRADSRAADDA
jgi:hypothetical protein